VPVLRFTPNLERHVACPSETVSGSTVREALDSYFTKFPGVRSYVLDEQGHVRHHVVLFVDGTQCRDRTKLADTVGANTEIFVMQALSGG